MDWNIVNGCLVGLKKDNENDNIAPAGISVRNGNIVAICFPDDIYAIGEE